jgi:hypothetical protein
MLNALTRASAGLPPRKAGRDPPFTGVPPVASAQPTAALAASPLWRMHPERHDDGGGGAGGPVPMQTGHGEGVTP